MTDSAGRRISRIASIPVIATLMFAAYFIAREGLADTMAIEALREVALWESGQPPRPDRFKEVERTLRNAIGLSPSNGDHWEALGSAWFARASAPGRTLEGRLNDFDRAVDAFREATRRTPASGFAWGNLVTAKHHAGQVDDELSAAIRNAARFSPQEAAVQAAIVGSVLPRWIELDGEARRIAANAVRTGWSDHRRELLVEASAARNRELWCDLALWPVEADLAASMDRLCREIRADGVNGSTRKPGRTP